MMPDLMHQHVWYDCSQGLVASKLDAVQPAKDWMRDNISKPLDRACAGCVLPQRNMTSHFIIIGAVLPKNSPKVLFAEHDQMIGALAPYRSDQAFQIPVLPGRAERDGPVPDAHGSHPSLERDTKCSVIVADKIFRRRVPRERFGDLTCQPLRRRVTGHCKPQQLSPFVPENKKCEELLEPDCRNHKEIDRRNPFHMVANKGFPGLQWPIWTRHHVD